MRGQFFRESCYFFKYIDLSGALILLSLLELGIRMAVLTCGGPKSTARAGPLKIDV